MNTTHWNKTQHTVRMVLETEVNPRLTYALSEQFRQSFVGVSDAALKAGILPDELRWLDDQARQIARSHGRRPDEETFITMQTDIELGGMTDVPCTFVVGWSGGSTYIALMHETERSQYEAERQPQ